MAWSAMIIPVEGRPYLTQYNVNKEDITLSKILKEIDDCGTGIELIHNQENLFPMIHPIFKKAHNKWLIVDLLLMDNRGSSDVTVYGPQCAWKYSVNMAVSAHYKREGKTQPLHGNLFIQFKTACLEKFCKENIELYFQEEEWKSESEAEED